MNVSEMENQQLSSCTTENEYIAPDTELRHMKPKSVFTLAAIIDQNEGWKSLMSIIPADIENFEGPLKYSTEDMRLIEEAGCKQGRTCSEILFEEWGTSSKKRPTFRTLLKCLQYAELYRAAEFVASELLNEPLPPRPSFGPAADVSVDDTNLCSLTVSDTGENVTCSTLLNGNESSSSIHYKSTTICRDYIESKVPNEHDRCVSTENTTQSVRTASTLIVGDQCSKTCDAATKSCRHLPYSVLRKATKDFNDEFGLGSGAFGVVYYGKIDGTELAIKVIKGVAEEAANLVKQFRCEVYALSCCLHKNILPLYAVSLDEVPCIIYEYMPNKTLQDRIACVAPFSPLSWERRVVISCGIADGLQFLHFGLKKPVIHRDIKSANILLDREDNPKIGDFGLVRTSGATRHTVVTETVIGTTAYMSPEAFRGDVSIQMDVYSFGVVLLELITGLPPYDDDRDGTDLVTHVDSTDDDLCELVDPKSGQWNDEVLSKIIHLSEMCLLEKKRRPSSKTIFAELQQLVNIVDNNQAYI